VFIFHAGVCSGFSSGKAPDEFPLANAPQFFPRMSIDPEIASKKICDFSRGHAALYLAAFRHSPAVYPPWRVIRHCRVDFAPVS
jgi:hypothetical protein